MRPGFVVPARREIESTVEIELAWDTALLRVGIPGVTQDGDGNVLVPEEIRAVFRVLFLKIMYRYLHVWQGEFLRKLKHHMCLKSEDPLRNKMKNKYKSKPHETDTSLVPRPPSEIIDTDD